MTLVVLAIVGLLAAVAVHDAIRRPTLRRLAVRNVLRRRGEAALIVTGCVLGAAIVTSSILVGDSLRASVRDVARTDLGPGDEMVRVPPDRLEAAREAVGGRLPDGAGVISAVRAPGVAVTVDGPARAEPHLQVLELDFAAGRRLGGDPATTGLARAGATPARGETVLEEDTARALGVGAGDRVRLLSVGGIADLRVRAVVPGVGLAGLGDQGDQEVANAFVAPGTLTRMARGATAGAQPAEALLLIANGRGVFGGVALTDTISETVSEALRPGAAVVVQPVKRDLVEAADEAGASFTALFAAIGAVAVIAGVLLLVYVFVMLAEER
jgi:putative ABC transport system permease protein